MAYREKRSEIEVRQNRPEATPVAKDTTILMEVSKSQKYENLRDDKLDALLSNTTDSGSWHIDFDPYVEHEPKEVKGWFDEHET